MKFDDLDSEMRVYETAHDFCVPPGFYMVARIDGRSFHALTKSGGRFEAPFDERFRDMMVATVRHLMECGFDVAYGYTQSDEISLLFALGETMFGRKLRKYDSVLAAEAASAFSLAYGGLAAFDCRVSVLPSAEHVVSYFRWRAQDAARNCLNAWCYWTLRKEGAKAGEATGFLDRKSVAEKNEFLHERGVNFARLPGWQKNGIGLYHKTVERDGFNPKAGKSVRCLRREIVVDMNLPARDAYGDFVRKLVQT